MPMQSWVSRGSSGLVCRRKDDAVTSGRSAVSQHTVKTGPAARLRRSGYGKLSTGKLCLQQCQLNCHGSRFRVLQDLESDDHRSGASAGDPSLAQRRPRKTALRQVSATDESCCRKHDDHRSEASAGHPSLAQRRPRKTALRQASACFNQSESCSRKQDMILV